MSNTEKHGDLCRCLACCAGEPLRPSLESVVPEEHTSRLSTMCRAAAGGLRWSMSKARLVARSDRVRQILACRMPRWFHRRTAVLTWAVLATLGLTPIFVSSLIDGDEIEQLENLADLEYRIDVAEHVVVVHIEVGSAEQVCNADDHQRLAIATRASRKILPVVRQHPNKVVVIDLSDVPLGFASLQSSDQWSFLNRFDQDAVRQYESSVARLLDIMVHKVQRAQPSAALSVLGLPIEPDRGVVSIEIARQSNELYRTVIDRLDSFVPGRSFIVFGTSLDELRLAQRGMPESLRLRDGRPVVFQTNVAWRVLMDAEEPGHGDYQIAASTKPGFELEAALSD